MTDAGKSNSPRPEQKGTGTPSISLPKGGGAIRGIGEKFAADPATGTGATVIPIATSPGRTGFGPKLLLSYDSGSGNGPFGFGWSLDLPKITRRTDKGLPQYHDAEESDIFILSHAEDLVPLLDPDGRRFADTTSVPGYTVHRYLPRIEEAFLRIERWTRRSDGDVHWRSISKDNVLTVYGKDASTRVADPSDPRRIFTWLICEERDDRGNAIIYDYKPEDGGGVDVALPHERNRGAVDDPRRTANRYIKHIRYGNRVSLLDGEGHRPRFLTGRQIDDARWMFESIFDYGEHDSDAPKPNDQGSWTTRFDVFSTYRAGFEVRTSRLCRRVLMFHHFPDEVGVGDDCLVRSTDFGYSTPQDPAHASAPVYTFLNTVTQAGYRRLDGGGYLKRTMPPVEYEYTQPVVQDSVHVVDAESLHNLPIGLDGNDYRWIDLHGEGIPGILSEQGGAWFYKRNLSPISDRPVQFGPAERVPVKPNLALGGGQAQFMDLASDGRADLVVMDGPMPGLYRHDDEESWEPFRVFKSRINRDTADPNLRFIDVDGDGLLDVLITEDDVFVWHPSLGTDGFGPGRLVRKVADPDESRGPRLLFEDEAESIYFADLSGDGLTDLVRIRNGEVCYWPNLGYGHFGAKVTMDHSPMFDSLDQFDQRRIRLADIDGSGTTDIIYLRRDGVRLYFNQSGNGWSAAQPLPVFPPTDDLTSVVAIDLLGNGTTCLVWSSSLTNHAGRQMRYVDLMGGEKPHLMVRTINNLGAETSVEYVSSTKFYLQDKQAGSPWITKLPFPVHVVERIVTVDAVSGNRFVTRYSYHHGFYDGVEREFRGFGRVDQLDTEEFATLTADGTLPAASNEDATSHVPPVLTKTWFHTGVFLGREHISDFFAGFLDARDVGEYYREPGLTDKQARGLLLDDTILPEGLTLQEEREACRALKRHVLRQEIYALDGSTKQPHPYTVSESNYTIRLLQRQDGNLHASFFIHGREAAHYGYERNPAEPRVSHHVTVEVDDFGDILKSATIAYGRRASDPELAPIDRATQATTLITHSDNRVTNALDSIDGYRAPQASELRVYQVTGLPPVAEGRHRFTFEEVRDGLATAAMIPFEAEPTRGTAQKRLIEHTRTLYRRDDLTGALPSGQQQALGLVFETYQLALTAGLLKTVYGDRVAPSMLQEDGRYLHGDGDADWWSPSGRVFFSPDPAATPAQELAEARAHFFLPRRFRDPFHTDAVGTERFVSYDVYDLLVQETRDALGNRVTVGERDLDPARPLVRNGNDYRVLEAALVMDANRNRTAAAFDALGMTVGRAVMGKPEDAPSLGDRLSPAFRPDLTQGEIDAFFADPTGPIATVLLDQATSRVVYDPGVYFRETDPQKKLPTFVATLARETHASDLVVPQDLRIQVGFSYRDGLGREIQNKSRAEAGPVPMRDAGGNIIIGADGQPQPTAGDGTPRWVGTGWTIFNNKGNPVRQFEPFFTDTHRLERDVRVGVSPITFYDPLGRVVATLHPDHTWDKVVFDSWRQETWDVNDTVTVTDPSTDPDVGNFFARLSRDHTLPTWYARRVDGDLGPLEQAAARQAAVHAATPDVAYADALDRFFVKVTHNRFKYGDADAGEPVDELYTLRFQLDIRGDQRQVEDALHRIVTRDDYDLLRRRIHQSSLEAGQRWLLDDVAGNPLFSWDSRDHRFRTTYDPLRRAAGRFMTEGQAAEIQISRWTYGESRPSPEASNLRTKLAEVADQAGILTSDEYDFKGNLTRSERRFADEYKTTLDWSTSVPMQEQAYLSRARYDALNRPTGQTAPDGSVIRPAYNEANLLERIDVNLRGEQSAGAPVFTPFITGVDYNARGQRTMIDYGNGARTTNVYDPFTFRVRDIVTKRDAGDFPDDCPQARLSAWPGCQVQSLHYTYDPSGNITHIQDDAQQTVYFRNQRVAPGNDYVYDAVYRLIEATGREHLGQIGSPPIPHSYNDAPRVGLPHPGDGRAMGRYLERYRYDAVGNITSMQHRGKSPANPGWTRAFLYAEASQIETARPSNRLTATTVASHTETYSAGGDGYDAHGNLLRLPQLHEMQWDFEDQLRMTQRQAVNQEDEDGLVHQGERTFYVYDGAGQRVRKVTELATGDIKSDRIYVGVFEIYRRPGTSPMVRESLHIVESNRRIALVETRIDTEVPVRLIRYQVGNHLGSVSLELDEQARIISYEEYTPYGSTSYQAVRSQTETAKRYRYTGRERDEESGLCYFGARYYAPWLARWTSCDPGGLIDGVNLYSYVKNNSIRRSDVLGLEGGENEDEPKGSHKRGKRKSTEDDHEEANRRRKREQEKREQKERDQEREKRRRNPKNETEEERTKRENQEKKERYRKEGERERKEKERDPEQERKDRERQEREKRRQREQKEREERQKEREQKEQRERERREREERERREREQREQKEREQKEQREREQRRLEEIDRPLEKPSLGAEIFGILVLAAAVFILLRTGGKGRPQPGPAPIPAPAPGPGLAPAPGVLAF